MKKITFCIQMLSGLVLLLAPALLFAGTVQLPQTGQTACYETAGGNTVPCDYGKGQDGDLREGVAWPDPRFADNGDQTVLDKLTGLVWAKDGNVMRTRDPAFDSVGTVGDGSATWQHARDYIKKLNQESYLGYNDWRLPNLIELASLIYIEGSPVHVSKTDSSAWLNSLGFSNVQAGEYWSSSTLAASPYGGPWIADMLSGVMSAFRYEAYVWPVRSGQPALSGSSTISLPKTGQTTCYKEGSDSDPGFKAVSCTGTGQDGELRMGAAWPTPRFTDNGDQTVLDNLTGLIWTKDGNAPGPTACTPGISKNWGDTLDSVKCLNTNNYLGHNDWRMPNRNELRSLVHYGETNSAAWLNSQGFYNVQESEYKFYWSSSTKVGDAYAWIVNLNSGYISNDTKSFGYSLWPVRSRKPVGKGDINDDGQVNLTDAVLALQIIAGISPQQTTYRDAAVNNDGKIGLAEVLYILQKEAVIR